MIDKIMKWFLFVLFSPFYVSTKWCVTVKNDVQKMK